MASVYLDGAALPSQISDSGPTDLWDISQVEILRGPQSTIQGENALAGAVILRSADPTMDWSGKVRAQWSDPDDKRVAFAGGGALVDDELAARLSLEKRDFDGYVWNPTRNQPEDAAESLLGRIKLLWTPSALPGLTARLTHMRDDREGPYMYSYASLAADDYFDNRLNYSNSPSSTDARTDVTTLELDYQLTNDWSLTAVTARTKADATRSYDNDLTAENLSFGSTDEHYKTTSQELSLHYDGDKLSALGGLYWSKREMDNQSNSLVNVPTPLDTIALVLQGAGLDAATAAYVAGLYGQALPVIPVDYLSKAPTQSENQAAFVDVEYQLAEQWSLLAGMRYDKEQYDFESVSTAEFMGTLPDPANYGQLGPAISGINMAVLGLVADAASETPASSRDFTAFLPKFGLRWQFAAEQSLAFTLQRGYRSGGSSYNIARGQVFAYEPEFTTNYELAYRSSWLDQSLTLNSNLYYIDWTDKQVIANFGNNVYDYHTVNAGKSHLYGAEFELRHHISSALDWYGSYAWSKTQYDEFETVENAQITDYSGQEFAYAPRHTAAVGSHWYITDQWQLNLNASFRSDVTTGPGADQIVLSSRTLLNARLSYDATQWSAYLFANNLLDKGYIQYRWPTDPVAIFGAPRVVGVGVIWQW